MYKRPLAISTRSVGLCYLCQSSRIKIYPTFVKNDQSVLKTGFKTSSFRCVGYKIQDNIKDCYSLLNIKEGCSEEELRESYIRLAKVYHPDSQSETADAKKFSQVKDAYRAIKSLAIFCSCTTWFVSDLFRNHIGFPTRQLIVIFQKKLQLEELHTTVEDEEDDDYESLLKWRAPQHRQYLSHEGIGSGTMSERQKQYEQLRVTEATNRIYKYRMKKLMPEGENAMVAKDKRAARTRKIRKNRYEDDDQWLKGATNKDNTLDRMVEDMILESMSKGHFDNLAGAGKPQTFSDKDKNPYVDKITAKLNQILINDDMKPEWITMQKELRDDMKHARQKLAIERRLLGDPPYSETELKKWQNHEEHFRAIINDINERINNFNLIVPILNKQMVQYNSDREIKKIYSDCDKYIPPNYDFTQHIKGYHGHMSNINEPLWKWKDMWKHIKGAFKSCLNLQGCKCPVNDPYMIF